MHQYCGGAPGRRRRAHGYPHRPHPFVGGGAALGGAVGAGVQGGHILGIPVHDERKPGQGHFRHPPVSQRQVDQRRNRVRPRRRRGMSRKIFGKVLHSLPGGAILISVIAISLTMEQNFLEVEPSCL